MGWPSELQLESTPVVLARHGRVVEATGAAQRAGARVGTTLTAGAPPSHPPGFTVLDWDAATVDREVTRGTALLLTASPQVTPVAGAPGMWWVAVGGPEQAGPGERAVARSLVRLARCWHPHARVGVASSCVAARVAVWRDRDELPRPGDAGDIADAAVRLVARGSCAAFIAAAPIGFVPMDDVLRRALLAAGVRTAGALAAHEASEVAARWGAPGLAAWRLARGDDARRPVLTCAASTRAVVAELATPAQTTQPLAALIRAALERLVRQLAAEQRQIGGVALTLTLDDGRGAHPAGCLPRTVTRKLRLPCPLGTAAPIASRCEALIARWALPAPVCGVRVEVTATGSGGARCA